MVQRRDRRTKVDRREQEDNYRPGETDPLLRLDKQKGENLRWSQHLKREKKEMMRKKNKRKGEGWRTRKRDGFSVKLAGKRADEGGQGTEERLLLKNTPPLPLL